MSISGIISAPGVPWTQWTGQSRVFLISDELAGLVIVTKDSYGLLSGGSWLEAKEMWSAGWKSFVATFRTNGRESRELIVEPRSLPPATAREPFCGSGEP